MRSVRHSLTIVHSTPTTLRSSFRPCGGGCVPGAARCTTRDRGCGSCSPRSTSAWRGSPGPAASTDDRHVLSAAVGALSRAGDPVVLPAAAAIGDEVIVVRTVRDEAVDELVGALERAWRRLADGPVRLAIGVGTRHVLPAGG